MNFSNLKTYCSALLLGLFLMSADACAKPIRIWNPAGGTVSFWWTAESKPIGDPGEPRKNDTEKGRWENFGEPPSDATDWEAWYADKQGKTGANFGAYLVKNPDGSWRWKAFGKYPPFDDFCLKIPDMIFTPSSPLSTLYTAINLEMYASNNPRPSIHEGDSVMITDGTIPGLEGIYWSTTPFTIDLTSSSGFSGTPYTGYAVSIGNTAIAETPTIALVLIGIFSLLAAPSLRERAKKV